MAHGIKIYNESGYTQIDQDFRNHEIVEQGTIYVPSGGVEFNVYEGYRQVNPLAMLLVQNDSELDYIAYTQSFESAGIAYLVLVREGPVLVGEVSGSISPGTTISYRIAIPAQSSYGWTTSWTTNQSTTTSWTTGNSTSISTSISTTTGLSTSQSTAQSTSTSWTTSRSTSQSTTTSWTTTVNTIVGGTQGNYTTTWNTSINTATSWVTSNSTSINTTTTWSTLINTSQTTAVGASTSISTSINTNTSWTTSWSTSRSTTTSWNTSQNTSILENSGNYYSRTIPQYYVYEMIGGIGGWGIVWNDVLVGGDNGNGGSLPASFTSGEYTYYKTGSILDPVYDAKNNVTTNYYTVYRTRTTTVSTSWSTSINTTTSWNTSQSTSRSTSTSWTTTWSSGSNITTTWSTSINTSISTATSWATSWNTSINTATSWSTSQSTYGTVPLNYQYSIATPYYHVEVGSYDLWYWNDVPVYNAPAAGLTSVTVGNYIYTRGPLQTSSFVKGTYYYYYSISRQEIVSTSWTTSISTTTSWTTSWTTNQSTTTTWTTSWTTGQSTTTSWTTSWTTGFNTSQSTTTTWATSITTGASPAASGGYGIKIFNPSGEPVFDSNKKYVKFHQLVSLNRDTSPNTQESYTNLAVTNYTPTPSIPWIEIGDISGTRLYFEVLGDPINGAYIVFAWAAVKTQNSLGVAKLRYVGGTPSNLGGYFTYLNLSTVAQILFSRD